MKINRELCSKCKGRLFCGLNYCPLLSKFKSVKIEKDEVQGSGVDVFIGRFHYPNVSFGIVNVPEVDTKDAEVFESHKNWISERMKIEEVVSLRTNTMFNFNKNDVKAIKFDEVTEIAMSYKPVWLDVQLKNRPNIQLKQFTALKPFGARAKFKKINIEDTPKIPQKVEYLFNDNAQKAVIRLNHKYNEDYIRRVFSVGTTGISKRMVPTRWSITAVDDILGKDNMDHVKNYDLIDNYYLFFSSLYGNYFLVLLLPNSYGYELFEMYTEKKQLIYPNPEHDYELFFGRKEYAKQTIGGYYASKLGVLEYLKKIKKQASIIVFRFITPAYTFPLGVWVVREGIRKTMTKQIKEFETKKQAIDFILNFSKRNFMLRLEQIIKDSKLLNQRSITDY